MTGTGAGSSLIDGGFLDGVVESSVHGLVLQLKAACHEEILRALHAARESKTPGERQDIMSLTSCNTSKLSDGERQGDPPAAADSIQQATLPCTASSPKADGIGETTLPNTVAAPEADGIEEVKLPHAIISPRLRATAESQGAWDKCRLLEALSPPGSTLVSLHPPGIPAPDMKQDVHEIEVRLSRRRSSRRHSSSRWSNDSAGWARDVKPLTKAEEKVIKDIRAEEEALERDAQRRFGGGTFSQRMTIYAMASADLSWSRRVALKICASAYFDFVMGFIIIANALTIGVESSLARRQAGIPMWLSLCEHLFLAIYCSELWLRLFGLGVTKAFQSNWVRFDALLVASGLLNIFLLVVSLEGDAAAQMVDNVNMLKMIRLFRLARTVRLFVKFRTLWLLVQGLMYAVMPMLWTSLVMFGVVYVFAIVGMETIVPPAAENEYSVAARNFETIWSSMTTLMQFMTLDSVALIYRPLVMDNPILAMYFLCFLLLGPIALMNIVTAIMVESSLRSSKEDQEAKKAWENMKRRTLMPKLRDIFVAMDENGDEVVDLQELLGAPEEIKEQMRRIVDLDQLEEIFHLLDYDASGSIDIDEFIDGIMRSQADRPSEFMVLMKQVREILEFLRTKR